MSGNFYPKEIMTPKAIKKLIDIFEEEMNGLVVEVFDEEISSGFAYLYGTYDVFVNFAEYIKEKYPKILEYNPKIFDGEVPSINELLSELEEWHYDILDFDSNPERSLNFSREVLADFIYQDELAYKEFEEFFTYDGITPGSSWFDPPFRIKEKFELYLKTNG